MPKLQVEAVLLHSLDDVAAACREAVTQVGWRLLDQSNGGLASKEETSRDIYSTGAAKVELAWRQEGINTRLTINGSIMGSGLLQSAHLTGEMANLQNRIQISLRKATSQQHQTHPASTPHSTVSAEHEGPSRSPPPGECCCASPGRPS